MTTFSGKPFMSRGQAPQPMPTSADGDMESWISYLTSTGGGAPQQDASYATWGLPGREQMDESFIDYLMNGPARQGGFR